MMTPKLEQPMNSTETELPLGAATSWLYQRREVMFYKFVPIPGMRLNWHFDVPVSTLVRQGDVIFHQNRYRQMRLRFIDNGAPVLKLRITPVYFGLIPFGITFAEISRMHKNLLFRLVDEHSPT